MAERRTGTSRKLSQDAEYVLDLLVAAGHITRETAFQARDIALDLAPGRTQNQIDYLAAPLRNAAASIGASGKEKE